ncbi:hypothetical protein D3C73_1594910 [compost metagenome]
MRQVPIVTTAAIYKLFQKYNRKLGCLMNTFTKLLQTNGSGIHCGGNMKILVGSFNAVVIIHRKGNKTTMEMTVKRA